MGKRLQQRHWQGAQRYLLVKTSAEQQLCFSCKAPRMTVTDKVRHLNVGFNDVHQCRHGLKETECWGLCLSCSLCSCHGKVSSLQTQLMWCAIDSVLAVKLSAYRAPRPMPAGLTML